MTCARQLNRHDQQTMVKPNVIVRLTDEENVKTLIEQHKMMSLQNCIFLRQNEKSSGTIRPFLS